MSKEGGLPAHFLSPPLPSLHFFSPRLCLTATVTFGRACKWASGQSNYSAFLHWHEGLTVTCKCSKSYFMCSVKPQHWILYAEDKICSWKFLDSFCLGAEFMWATNTLLLTYCSSHPPTPVVQPFVFALHVLNSSFVFIFSSPHPPGIQKYGLIPL